MFFLIGKNHPYYDDLNKHTNQNFINKQIEAIEIQLKKKYERVQDFNPEDCYNHSQASDEEDFQDSDVSSEESQVGVDKKQDSQLIRGNTYGTFFGSTNTEQNKKMYHINEKKSLYRRLMKLFDIFAMFLIILGAILSQYEHELYYYNNIFNRVTAIVMINYAYNNPTNHSMKFMFDNRAVNLTELTINSHTSLEELYLESLGPIPTSNTTVVINDTYVMNPDLMTTNEYFISRLNMSRFTYEDNVTDYTNISVPLDINSTSRGVRVILLFTTIASCLLLFFSRYFEHVREYVYKKEQELSFHKGEYFFLAILEIMVIIPVQYPGINSYIIFTSLGSTLCLPATSILASISIFRFIFIYKVLRHFSVWNSEQAERKCERFVCQADTKFAFKAIQKEFPFMTLLIIFILTCVCFGFNLRNFELHYWEAQPELGQNWRYHWNAMWCVFVSMTTVGFGDFYPKTHPGRFIVIIACVVGIYFVSMMMVFMTQKSILNESEQKAYKLITRLKLRNEIKNIQAHIVSHYLTIVLLKKKKSKSLLSDKDYQIKSNYEKRSIISWIDERKVKDRNIKHLEFIPTKEQLFDICERIDTDIKEIKQEINSLSYINDSIIGYTESQVDMVKYLKKNIYATKLMYGIIEKKPKVFGDLANFDRNIINEDESRYYNMNMTINTHVNLNQTVMADEDKKKGSVLLTGRNEENKFTTIISNENNNVMGVNNNVIEPNELQNDKSFSRVDTSVLNRSRQRDEEEKEKGGPTPELTNIINPNQFDENINKLRVVPPLKLETHKYNDSDDELDDEYYADELTNYNVAPEEIKEHFNFLFFNQNDPNSNSKRVIKKNTIRTIQTIKNMKKTQSKLKMILNLKRNTNSSPRKRTAISLEN